MEALLFPATNTEGRLNGLDWEKGFSVRFRYGGILSHQSRGGKSDRVGGEREHTFLFLLTLHSDVRAVSVIESWHGRRPIRAANQSPRYSEVFSGISLHLCFSHQRWKRSPDCCCRPARLWKKNRPGGLPRRSRRSMNGGTAP